MVGSAIVRALHAEGFQNIVTRTSKELDLRQQRDVNEFFEREKPNYIFMAAARVGGILANNTYRAESLYDNLMIEANCINAAYQNNVQKLLFLGSSCIYPRNAPQPLKEEYFLTGVLEPTNEPYAIAKIAGIKMCDAYRAQYGCNYISAMPTNLYGPNDNYDLKASHVLPALMRKFIEAKRNNANSVAIWGTGTPKREFLHVDDFASASLYLMEHFNEAGFVNVGTGIDLSIRELAERIRDVSGFTGDIVYDTEKPDGMPRKLMDVSRLRSIGWTARISLEEGLQRTYNEVKDTEW
jgi:GDP-L-fucose synthase